MDLSSEVEEGEFHICYDRHCKGINSYKQGATKGGEGGKAHPTRMPSSISVGDTRSPSLTTNLAICFTLMTYLLFSLSLSS